MLIASLVLFFVNVVFSQNPIRLDDTYTFGDSNPNGIQFSNSQWMDFSPQRAGMRYNGTYSATNSSGANIVLFFRGKSIKYYGDRDPAGGTATARIDGQSYANVSVAAPVSGFQSQQLLWSSPALDSSDHQIVISNFGVRGVPKRGIVGLDFFEIVPTDIGGNITSTNLGPGASEVPKEAILINDSDGSIIYAGNGWQIKPSTPDSTIYLQGSAHTTRFPGESLIFQFTGTAVWYFTDYSLGNAMVAISVDGGPPDVVDTAPTNKTLSRSQRMMWSKTGLNDGTHSVAITHAGSAGSWATIDFFKVLTSSNAGIPITSVVSLSSITSTISTTPVTSATSRRSSTRTSTTLAASTNLSTTPNSESSPLGGAIAGAVIGGALGLILLAFGVIVIARRRRARKTENAAQSTEPRFR